MKKTTNKKPAEAGSCPTRGEVGRRPQNLMPDNDNGNSDLDQPSISEALLGTLEAHFNAGDKNALLQAVRLCGRDRRVMPDWVVDAFHKATNEWYSMRVKTLDEAFGLTWPKGKHFNAAKRQRELGLAVFTRCKAAIHDGDVVDVNLFEKIGREFGIGKTLCERYYYSWKNLWQI